MLERPRTTFALGKYCFLSLCQSPLLILFSSQAAWEREARAVILILPRKITQCLALLQKSFSLTQYLFTGVMQIIKVAYPSTLGRKWELEHMQLRDTLQVSQGDMETICLMQCNEKLIHNAGIKDDESSLVCEKGMTIFAEISTRI